MFYRNIQFRTFTGKFRKKTVSRNIRCFQFRTFTFCFWKIESKNKLQGLTTRGMIIKALMWLTMKKYKFRVYWLQIQISSFSWLQFFVIWWSEFSVSVSYFYEELNRYRISMKSLINLLSFLESVIWEIYCLLYLWEIFCHIIYEKSSVMSRIYRVSTSNRDTWFLSFLPYFYRENPHF